MVRAVANPHLPPDSPLDPLDIIARWISQRHRGTRVNVTENKHYIKIEIEHFGRGFDVWSVNALACELKKMGIMVSYADARRVPYIMILLPKTNDQLTLKDLEGAIINSIKVENEQAISLTVEKDGVKYSIWINAELDNYHSEYGDEPEAILGISVTRLG